MCDLAVQNESSEYLVWAACLLTRLHELSPSNVKAMLMTVKIFHWLGFTPNASQVYETIEPKYIQYDSLGYLHTGRLAPFSWSQTTVKYWYGAATRFFMASAKESVDYLAMSYRTGTFSKLQELLDFRDRLMNSHQNHHVLVESAILEVVLMAGSAHSPNFAGVQQLRNLNINPEHRVDADTLVDNRDLEVLIRWDPVVVNDFDDDATRERKRGEGLEFVREQSFKEQVLLLRIRKALLNLVVAQVNGLTGQLHHGKQYVDIGTGGVEGKDDGSADFVATLKKLRAEWTDLFEALPAVQQTHYKESYLVNRLLSQLHCVVQVPYESFLGHLSALSLALIEGESAGVSVTQLGQSVVAAITELVDLARAEVKRNNEAKDQLWGYRECVEKTAAVVELLSLATLVVALLERRPAKGAGKNTGANTKKPKEAATKLQTATTTTTSEGGRAKQATIAAVTKCLKEQLVAMESLLGNKIRASLLVLFCFWFCFRRQRVLLNNNNLSPCSVFSVLRCRVLVDKGQIDGESEFAYEFGGAGLGPDGKQQRVRAARQAGGQPRLVNDGPAGDPEGEAEIH